MTSLANSPTEGQGGEIEGVSALMQDIPPAQAANSLSLHDLPEEQGQNAEPKTSTRVWRVPSATLSGSSAGSSNDSSRSYVRVRPRRVPPVQTTRSDESPGNRQMLRNTRQTAATPLTPSRMFARLNASRSTQPVRVTRRAQPPSPIRISPLNDRIRPGVLSPFRGLLPGTWVETPVTGTFFQSLDPNHYSAGQRLALDFINALITLAWLISLLAGSITWLAFGTLSLFLILLAWPIDWLPVPIAILAWMIPRFVRVIEVVWHYVCAIYRLISSWFSWVRVLSGTFCITSALLLKKWPWIFFLGPFVAIAIALVLAPEPRETAEWADDDDDYRYQVGPDGLRWRRRIGSDDRSREEEYAARCRRAEERELRNRSGIMFYDEGNTAARDRPWRLRNSDEVFSVVDTSRGPIFMTRKARVEGPYKRFS